MANMLFFLVFSSSAKSSTLNYHHDKNIINRKCKISHNEEQIIYTGKLGYDYCEEEEG